MTDMNEEARARLEHFRQERQRQNDRILTRTNPGEESTPDSTCGMGWRCPANALNLRGFVLVQEPER
jgi:phage terminase large subunit-like protein